MKCLQRYQWVKLPRNCLTQGKGILGYWAKLAARAAFRKGQAKYCSHINDVTPGMWAGGIVGVKSILGVRSRAKALEVLDQLQSLGYIEYSLNSETKKLTYQITDWVVKCSGNACMDGAVYTTAGYGFLCVPRKLTERLVRNNYRFDEADAWLDLWCHTTFEDPCNAFSYAAPTIQYGKYGVVLSLETLGQRWGWEKTKVWRFFKKHGDAFSLHRLPGNLGCLIFNMLYPTGTVVAPENTVIMRILEEIRIHAGNTYKAENRRNRINRAIAWYSRYIGQSNEGIQNWKNSRVAVSALYTRAYFSQCWNRKNCDYDCRSSKRSNGTTIFRKEEVPWIYQI